MKEVINKIYPKGKKENGIVKFPIEASIAIDVTLIVFSIINLVFLCLLRRNKYEECRAIENSGLKQKNHLNYCWSINNLNSVLSDNVNNHPLREYLPILISSVSMLIAGLIVLKNLKI